MNGPRYVALFLAGVAVASVGGVWLAARETAQAYDERMTALTNLPHLVPAYPNSRAMPLGEAVHVSGLSRELAYALTPDSPIKVADRYESIWRSQGLRVHRAEQDGAEWVTAFAVEDPWVRTVVASATEQGTVLVQSVRAAQGEFALPIFPLPSSCELLDHTGARDQGVTTEVVFFACEGYLAEVLGFYDDLLVDADRRVRLTGPSADSSIFVTYAGQSLEVSLAATQTGDPPRVAATVTWQER